MRLLCVEDEQALREDISEYLRMHAYEVDEAASGIDAVTQLNRHHYDLVLCDIKMPQMDGYELLRQVRNENGYAATPFIFLSALSDSNDRIRAHQGGCDGYLTKPIDFSVLDATIKSHIERQRARDFLNSSMLECNRLHMMTAIDDALSGPISEAALTLEQVRAQLPSLALEAIDADLSRIYQFICSHTVGLHAFHSALQLQIRHAELMSRTITFDALVEEAIRECRYYFPSAAVRFSAHTSDHFSLEGDQSMLARAIAGLLGMVPYPHASSEILRGAIVDDYCQITISDIPPMAEDSGFMYIDAATNLVALSPVTRRRLIALSYATQVAQAHRGWLEIKLWSNDDLAVRMKLPVSDS